MTDQVNNQTYSVTVDLGRFIASNYFFDDPSKYLYECGAKYTIINYTEIENGLYPPDANNSDDLSIFSLEKILKTIVKNIKTANEFWFFIWPPTEMSTEEAIKERLIDLRIAMAAIEYKKMLGDDKIEFFVITNGGGDDIINIVNKLFPTRYSTTIDWHNLFKRNNFLDELREKVLRLNHSSTKQKPPKLFIIYSKHDSEHKDSLLDHLTSLKDRIATWHDSNVLPGEDWDKRIKDELNNANIVLYLVSPNSMASEYIQNIELPLIQKRHQNNECVLIPIIVDFYKWEELDFAKNNVLPNNGKPITDNRTWVNKNHAWANVVEGLQILLKARFEV